jgi:ribonuclease P protein component
MIVRQTFKKEERLTNKKVFENLFNSGKSFVVPPFRWVWIESKFDASFPVQLGISVPKKSFPKAVDRNKIKRRIRESYRKNKHPLYEILQKTNRSIALMIIYVAKQELPYAEIEKKMLVSLQKMVTILQ